MSEADDRYQRLMTPTPKATPTGPRRYWRAVVRCGAQNGVGGMSRSLVEWHAASCAAPRNDCAGCEP